VPQSAETGLTAVAMEDYLRQHQRSDQFHLPLRTRDGIFEWKTFELKLLTSR
jgi:hypothetical protein